MEIVTRTKTWFTRIETIIVNVLQFAFDFFLFRKLSKKRHPIHFWNVCFMAALFLIWNVHYDVPGTFWFCRSRDGMPFFFYFLGEKSPATVAKVPAIAGSRQLFWTLLKVWPFPQDWKGVRRCAVMKFFENSSSFRYQDAILCKALEAVNPTKTT